MQVIVSGARVSSVAYIRNHFSLPDILAGSNFIRITLKMGVVEDKFFVGAELVDSYAAAFALEESDDFAFGDGQHWRSGRRDNINRVMRPPF